MIWKFVPPPPITSPVNPNTFLSTLLSKPCLLLWREAKFLEHKKVKSQIRLYKIKVNFTLEQAMKAQKGSSGIGLLFL